jgi:hypothetical protein
MNAEAGWDIAFKHQPAKSLDCNTFNLAFFHSIHTLQEAFMPDRSTNDSFDLKGPR